MRTDIRAAPGSAGGGARFSSRRAGYWIFMSSSSDDRVEQRAADLLPEERSAGSADPQAQAAAVLAESDEREADVDAAPDSFLEHRTAEQAAPPPGTNR
jgi:hypothetical protein